MLAGMLRERVTVRNPVVTVNDDGQAWYRYTGVVQETATVWASVRATSQSKAGDGESQPIGSESYEVRMRYRDDVGYETRLEWGSLTLEVVGIENVRNLGHELRLSCEVVDL